MVWCILVGCSRPTPGPETPLTVATIPELLPLAKGLAAAYGRSSGGPAISVVTVRQARLAEALSNSDASLGFTYGLSATGQISSTVIAWEVLVIAVPVTNPVQGLTLGQVRQIFSGQIANWADIGGYSQPIIPLSREDGAQGRLIFEQVVMGQDARVTRNAWVLASDEGMVATLANVPGAIGYTSLRSLTPEVKPLSLDGVPPGVVAVQRGLYPLVMPVAVLSGRPPLGAARAFLRFVEGKEGQAVLQSLGYIRARQEGSL